MADDGRPLEELCRALLSSTGEVSGVAAARIILARYRSLDLDGKRRFFEYLTQELDIDAAAVEEQARAYQAEKSRTQLSALIASAEPVRQELLRRLNQAPGATADLVAMRVDLLRLMADDADLERTDLDFAHLFGSWFNRGFLVLRRISWETPANILEKIIEYEAVHEIGDWNDLRRRLEPQDRRCFAYFHPAMPDEPLIFVEVALANGVPVSIQDVLASDRDVLSGDQANTAVFYSISNCQAGLRGISFGNSLIKQVVEELSREIPRLRKFVTLSPIPGFGRWLADQKNPLADGLGIDKPTEMASKAEQDDLKALAASYLCQAKREDGYPIDPVARFHLGNGAVLHDIHPLADNSPKGLRQSCGVMVSYLYRLDRIEKYHEDFVTDGKVATSKSVRALLKTAPKAAERTEHEHVQSSV